MATPSEGNRNLARIRDNQRRSRARKKEYVEELEQRVREYERQNVQATAQVQAAARKVADENKKLRALLKLHGVSEGSIQEYLAAGAGAGDGNDDDGRKTFTSLVSQARIGAPMPQQQQQHHQQHQPQLQPQQQQCSVIPQNRAEKGRDEEKEKEEEEEHDCSAAADLISLMTGANPHEVRASMGCAPGTNCRVNDDIVGDAIDRLTTHS